LPYVYVEPGKYVIEAAASSRDIRLSAEIQYHGKPLSVFVTPDTPMGDLLKIPGGEQIVQQLTEGMAAYFDGGSDATESTAVSQEMAFAMIRDLPLHVMSAYAGAAFPKDALDGLIHHLNEIQKSI